MYIWTSILFATMGLMTAVCDIGHGPGFELMKEIPLEEEGLELGAHDSSSIDFQDVIQDNDQDKNEANTRDHFSGAVPALDSVVTLGPNSDSYYLRHKHLDTYVVIKIVRMARQFILPITSTALYGQDLLWKHTKDEIIEEYIGVESYPPIIQDFVGIFVMKKINGVFKRIMAFSYKSNGKYFSYEPDKIYVESNVDNLYKDIESVQIGTTNNLGVRQLLFENARRESGQQSLYLNLVILADNSVFKRIKNVTSLRSLPIDESFTRASSYLLELEDMFHWIPFVKTNKYRLYGTISEVQVCTRPEETAFIQRSEVTIGTIDGQRALSFYKLLKPHQTQMENPNHVVVVITSNKIYEGGMIVSGVHSNGFGCQGSVIIVTHEELHGTEKKIRDHLNKMLAEAVNGEPDSLDSILASFQKRRIPCLQTKAVQSREGLGPQELDVHDQCQLTFGNDFVACRKSLGGICSILRCRKMTDREEEGKCITTPGMKSLPRTPCDDGKFCHMELCSSDVKAPKVFGWPLEKGASSEGSPSCSEGPLITILLGLTSAIMVMVAVLCALVFKNILEIQRKRCE